MKIHEYFTADRDLRVDIVTRRGGLEDAPQQECRQQKAVLLGVIDADPQVRVHLQDGSTYWNASAAATTKANKRVHYARPEHTSFDERSHKLATLAMESFWALRP